MPHVRSVALLAGLVLALAGCSGSDAQGDDVDPSQVDAVEAPELGACRLLTAEDVAQPTNATRVVDCSEEHTAQTYAIGQLPEQFDDAEHDSGEVGAWAYRTCSEAFANFLGADESLVMRTLLTWAWFRPSEQAWEDGARWYRCDVIGGGEHSDEYVPLPEDAKGLLSGKPDDEWMVCAVGPTLAGGARVPCSEPHEWRAVSTIKVGEPDEPYPGDRVVEVTTRDYCSESVGAILGYPVDYEFAYTWFHEAEWEVGNRRSVCWAKTAD